MPREIAQSIPTDREQTAIDNRMMARALAQARLAAITGEVPVGAVVVADNGTILAEAGNDCINAADPSGHAEMRALRQAAHVVGNYRLPGVTVYVTLEPCPMCAGAIVHVRLARVVFGASDTKAGAAGSALNLLQFPGLNHRSQITAGVREPECRGLLQSFFAERRKERE